MYAIVDIAGQQFKVQKSQQLFVHRLEGNEGDSVNFDKVLLVDNEGKVDVGMPTVKGASISAKIVSHLKGDKVLVFKKKRRGLGVVGVNAADLGGRDEHKLRFCPGKEFLDRVGIQQVDLLAGAADEVVKSLPLKFTPDGAAHQTAMAGHVNTGMLGHHHYGQF